MKLTACLLQFFDLYLSGLKGASKHTVKTYRDTFTLFLPFAARYHSRPINSLEVEHLVNDLIMDFLDYLETERRNILPPARNPAVLAGQETSRRLLRAHECGVCLALERTGVSIAVERANWA